MQIIGAFLASLGFAIIFNVPKEKLFGSGLCGGIGAIAYLVCHLYYESEVVALFIAALSLTLASEVLARIIKCPSTLFMICALIPFVPGGGMYYTILNIVEHNNDLALQYGLNTVAYACSIVVGCVLATSFVKSITKRKGV